MRSSTEREQDVYPHTDYCMNVAKSLLFGYQFPHQKYRRRMLDYTISMDPSSFETLSSSEMPL